MIKKPLLILMFLSIISCGYERIIPQKNNNKYNFSLDEITFKGDRVVNLKVKEKLNVYKINKTDKHYKLIINTTSEKIIIAKDLKGDPTNFKNITTLYVDVLVSNNIKKKLTYEASYNYSNDKNKSNLKNYEKQIKENLAETVTNKLILKLSNIK
jgi:hypothetical protein|tara:strand:+ start:1006 stop:1470 length:465 start_codon:yes stop_codon:yes gene_type:complete